MTNAYPKLAFAVVLAIVFAVIASDAPASIKVMAGCAALGVGFWVMRRERLSEPASFRNKNPMSGSDDT